jgi:hypothetical protein
LKISQNEDWANGGAFRAQLTAKMQAEELAKAFNQKGSGSGGVIPHSWVIAGVMVCAAVSWVYNAISSLFH